LKKSVKLLYANIGKLITSSLKFSHILQGIMDEIHLFFAPEYWSLLRYDEISDELYFVIFNGTVNLHRVNDIRLKPGEGIAGSVFQKKSPYFVRDTMKEKNFSHKVDERTGFQTKSIIAVPLVYRDKAYGVIEIINPADGTLFSEEELLILQTIADFAAIAFANATLYDSVVKLSETDMLTGAFNRVKLNQVMEQMKSPRDQHRRRQEKNYVCAFIMDLNEFKEINDTHGHLKGDQVLKESAWFFRSCMREDDNLFRVGGDEFLILLQCSTEEELEPAQERVLGLLEREGRKLLIENIDVRFSVGYARGLQNEIVKVIDMADARMYREKNRKPAAE
jgi:diguanylate cyclase (GGDEF)-like protein